MTLQELTNSVISNLGDRSEGTIGQQTVESVILQGANFALPQCVKLSNPEYYDRTLPLAVIAGGPTEVVIPPVVVGNDNLRVKDIVYYRVSRDSDGTPITMVRKSWFDFLRVTPDYDQQHSGVPAFLAFREGNMYLNRVPEANYNFTLYVEVWPKLMSSSDLSSSLPIDVQWDLALEAYTTYYCYLKLQQTALSAYWKDLYEDQKSVNTQQTRKLDIRGDGVGGGLVTGTTARPWLQPFTQSWN